MRAYRNAPNTDAEHHDQWFIQHWDLRDRCLGDWNERGPGHHRYRLRQHRHLSDR
jgi:hypothetical protein